jgi:Family of unknown function (DUF6518)
VSVSVPTPTGPGPHSHLLGHQRSRIAIVVVLGLAVGCLTSFGQGHLPGALDAFVNSASAWLVAPFVVGALMLTRWGAAGAGLTTCSLQLVEYYLTAQLRGHSPGGAIVAFWAACALLGGPVFGTAGHLWRNPPSRLRGLGAAVLASSFLAEGLWSYLHELHYDATAALWIAIGASIAILSARGRLTELRWIAVTLPIGLIGEIALTTIYRQSF